MYFHYLLNLVHSPPCCSISILSSCHTVISRYSNRQGFSSLTQYRSFILIALLRRWDSNPRPLGYEPSELANCSTPLFFSFTSRILYWLKPIIKTSNYVIYKAHHFDYRTLNVISKVIIFITFLIFFLNLFLNFYNSSLCIATLSTLKSELGYIFHSPL